MIPFGFGYPYLLLLVAGLLAVHVLLGVRPALVVAAQAASVALTWRIHRTHTTGSEGPDSYRKEKASSPASS